MREKIEQIPNQKKNPSQKENPSQIEIEEQKKKKYDPVYKFVRDIMGLNPEEFNFRYKTVVKIEPDPERKGHFLGTFIEFSNYHDLCDFRKTLFNEEKEEMDKLFWGETNWNKITISAKNNFRDRLRNPEDELYKYRNEFYKLYDKIKDEEIEDDYAKAAEHTDENNLSQQVEDDEKSATGQPEGKLPENSLSADETKEEPKVDNMKNKKTSSGDEQEESPQNTEFDKDQEKKKTIKELNDALYLLNLEELRETANNDEINNSKKQCQNNLVNKILTENKTTDFLRGFYWECPALVEIIDDISKLQTEASKSKEKEKKISKTKRLIAGTIITAIILGGASTFVLREERRRKRIDARFKEKIEEVKGDYEKEYMEQAQKLFGNLSGLKDIIRGIDGNPDDLSYEDKGKFLENPDGYYDEFLDEQKKKYNGFDEVYKKSWDEGFGAGKKIAEQEEVETEEDKKEEENKTKTEIEQQFTDVFNIASGGLSEREIDQLLIIIDRHDTTEDMSVSDMRNAMEKDQDGKIAIKPDLIKEAKEKAAEQQAKEQE